MSVDVASGTLFHALTDFVMPGRYALRMERRYSTALPVNEPGGLFGPGWRCPFEVTLQRTGDGYDYVGETGESIVSFACEADGSLPVAGVVDHGACHELHRVGDELVVTRWNTDTGEVLRDVFGVVEASDVAIRPLRRERPDGEGLAFSYTADTGLLKHVVQLRERRGFTFEHDARGRLIRLVRRASPWRTRAGTSSGTCAETVFRYGYDARGRLVEIVDPDGNTAHYAYDAAGRMVEESTLAGKRHRFAYDELGRCVLTTAPQHFDHHRLEYGRAGMPRTSVTGPDGGVTRYQFNAVGQVVRRTSPLDRVERNVFDLLGRRVQSVSAEGAVNSRAYDDAGNLASLTQPDGNEMTFAYGRDRQLEAVVDVAGGRWTFERDACGRLLREVDPLGTERHLVRDQRGDLTEVRVDGAVVERLERDRAGEVVAREDADGRREHFVRDAFGRVLEYHRPGAALTRVERDVHGRVRRVTLPGGGVRRYDWDVFDHVTREIDEMGAETLHRFCPCGNLEEIVRPDGSRATFGWNAVPGQLSTVTNEIGEVWHFDHDADGRLVGERDFAGRETRYAYDQERRALRVRKASGRIIDIVHGVDGRPTSISDGSGNELRSYVWDARGLLIGATNGEERLTFEYDAIGRLVEEFAGDRALRHAYDALDRRVARRATVGDEDESSSTTRYTWSPAGLLRRVDAACGSGLSFEYGARGYEARRRSADGLEIHTTHDADGRLSTQRLSSGTGTSHRTFEHDVRGELVRRTWTDEAAVRTGETRYDVDSRSRVNRAVHSDGAEETLLRDAVGNLVARDGVAFSHERGSLVRRAGDVSFEHDADGRVTARTDDRGTTLLRWNSIDELVGVTDPEGEEWAYAYDPLGRRIFKGGPNAVHRFEWDGDDMLAETCVRDGTARRTEWEHHPFAHAVLFGVRNGAMHLALTDEAGTPEAFVGPDGRRSWSHATTLYGITRHLDAERFECNLRFPGQYHDAESGFAYSRYRYYSPEIGAFISDDPIGLDGGMALRAYVPNPLAWIDPLGLSGQRACSIDDGGLSGPAAARSRTRMQIYFLLFRVFLVVGSQDTETPGIEFDSMESAWEVNENRRRLREGIVPISPPEPVSPVEPPFSRARWPRARNSPRPKEPHVSSFASNKGSQRANKWR